MLKTPAFGGHPDSSRMDANSSLPASWLAKVGPNYRLAVHRNKDGSQGGCCDKGAKVDGGYDHHDRLGVQYHRASLHQGIQTTSGDPFGVPYDHRSAPRISGEARGF